MSGQKIISYSSPAKVILSGEHAVVFGKPALVAAIDLRLKVSLWPSDKQNQSQPISIIKKLVEAYLLKQKIRFQARPFNYAITSQIPMGRGLGSSAALACAGSAAILQFYSQKQVTKEEINTVAYEVEKYYHQTPSGVDNSVSCLGGLVFYRKEFEFLKNINLLPFDIPSSINKRLFLIDSGKAKESTAKMVLKVKNSLIKQNKNKVLSDIENTTKMMVIALKQNDVCGFKSAININQRLLAKLAVVSPSTKLLLKKLGQYGVGKITGAGGVAEGSGYILFFADQVDQLCHYLDKHKITYFKFSQDNKGTINLSQVEKKY